MVENPYSASLSPSTERPTRVRFGVLFFLCTLALVLYIDRICIGQAESTIREELKLTKEEMGWVAAAFTLAYVLFEVPMGHWGDRFGSRGVIARIVVWWSAFTALTGAAGGFVSLIAVRFLFGAGEAGAFPNTARVVTRWFPAPDRGKARGAITTTSLIGAALAPFAAGYLIELVGWRYTFAIFGSLGLVWAAAFYAWFRDDPAVHPGVNAAERELIGAEPPAGAVHHESIPWKHVLASPNVWLMGAIMTVSAGFFYALFNWYPTYLQEAHALSKFASSIFTSLVMAGGAIGCIGGGYLADWAVRRTGERRWSRRIVGAGSMALAAACVALIPRCQSALTASLASAGAMFCVQLMIPTWWSVVAEVSGRHGAAMFGLMNSLGGFGAMGAPLATSYVVAYYERQGLKSSDAWMPVVSGGSAVLAIGVLCWLMVDATRSVVGRGSHEPDAQARESRT